MKIRFIKNYVVKGPTGGEDTVYAEGDVIEVEDGSHFIKRQVAVEVTGKAEPETASAAPAKETATLRRGKVKPRGKSDL